MTLLASEGEEKVPFILRGTGDEGSFAWEERKKGEYLSVGGLGGFTNGQGYFDLVLEVSPDDENMVFFVGRLVTVKGVDNLVKAMPSVIEEFPNTKLVILGIGDMEWDLKRMAENFGIADKIIFRTEFISEPERIKHYAAADCVVLPSIYEPFGIVCTESMSLAKPTVVGAKGTNGFREQIIPTGDNQCGYHINPFEPVDIAWGIKEVLADKKRAEWMGENARKRVLDTFSWEIITKKLLDIYSEFI